jgi:hypothetical protein
VPRFVTAPLSFHPSLTHSIHFIRESPHTQALATLNLPKVEPRKPISLLSSYEKLRPWVNAISIYRQMTEQPVAAQYYPPEKVKVLAPTLTVFEEAVAAARKKVTPEFEWVEITAATSRPTAVSPTAVSPTAVSPTAVSPTAVSTQLSDLTDVYCLRPWMEAVAATDEGKAGKVWVELVKGKKVLRVFAPSKTLFSTVTERVTNQLTPYFEWILTVSHTNYRPSVLHPHT